MQAYPPAPPTPLFGILAWGFILISIYFFARLASEGEGRYIGCKKALAIGILGMTIITLFESLNYWYWSLTIPAVDANPFLVWGASLMFGLLFVVVPLVDLLVQHGSFLEAPEIMI